MPLSARRAPGMVAIDQDHLVVVGGLDAHDEYNRPALPDGAVFSVSCRRWLRLPRLPASPALASPVLRRVGDDVLVAGTACRENRSDGALDCVPGDLQLWRLSLRRPQWRRVSLPSLSLPVSGTEIAELDPVGDGFLYRGSPNALLGLPGIPVRAITRDQAPELACTSGRHAVLVDVRRQATAKTPAGPQYPAVSTRAVDQHGNVGRRVAAPGVSPSLSLHVACAGQRVVLVGHSVRKPSRNIALQYDIVAARWRRVRRPDLHFIRQLWFPVWSGHELIIPGPRPISYDPGTNGWRDRPELAPAYYGPVVLGDLAMITFNADAGDQFQLQPLPR